ncbi:Dihydroflavonol-4-reductase [Wickerhamomyces ciferrii]|uniref:Dihydroflavonol-4-reductase n=1 Tax=Wickerhamomyces ciferrii (strain ATCC 14091 / BCRC 22168 / CBS 111 / JCM 3599 / NBRC 0793 / NRRL Y-1031 F-60-10) TaxID=1206466 RepID=K0KFF6_WICCF|nr:Dihydroflavonol-4-reductase [Wickerhamomyces ciferrii]CCH43855.1 Dihydroflavonol-4-reductase [Wickerhamomyces ciferrii]
MSTKTVLLTGASGFIALHTLDQLLKRNYTVIGTVRSQDKADNITVQFKKEYPSAQLTFAIVEDIGASGAFNKVFQDHPEIEGVLHTASPFSFGLNKDFKDAYFTPATEGTKNVLEAIQNYGKNVKNVVVTSSNAAVANADKVGDKTFIHTEETWNPITWDDVDNELKAYIASKKLAEKLAWEFVAEQKPLWKLTTVNPTLVWGPQKFESSLANKTLNTSAEAINKLLSSDPNDTHFFDKPIGTSIDVRDVALLHVLPLENENVSGKRLYPIQDEFNGQRILNIINRNFPELESKIAKGSLDGADKHAEENTIYYDTSKTLEWTGIKSWIPLEETVKDSVRQILDYRSKH